MGWVRVDDHFDEHPKLAKVGPLGWGLWLKGLAYCNRNLTDGFIPRSVAHAMSDFELVDASGRLHQIASVCGYSGDDIDSEWVIDFLLSAGVWDEAPGGYVVHDYLEYQPSKEKVLADRARLAARVAKHRNGASNTGSNAVGNADTSAYPTPNPSKSPQSSSSDSGKESPQPVDDEVEEALRLYVDRKLAATPGVKSPVPWKRKTLENARTELGVQAVRWMRDFDVRPTEVADALVAGQASRTWTRRR